jgi:FixJ family two-component response regulator
MTRVVAFLPKPFAAAQLFATVERALDRDRHGRDRDAEE